MLYNKESTSQNFINSFFSGQTFLISNRPFLKSWSYSSKTHAPIYPFLSSHYHTFDLLFACTKYQLSACTCFSSGDQSISSIFACTVVYNVLVDWRIITSLTILLTLLKINHRMSPLFGLICLTFKLFEWNKQNFKHDEKP